MTKSVTRRVQSQAPEVDESRLAEMVQTSILGDTPTEFTDEASSLVAAACYDSEQQRLEVDLKAGPLTKRYAYAGVPAQVWVEFYQAMSRGSYFNRHIRPMYQGSLL